ncbi:MAG: 30S ribosomal protein S1 [Ardenticatenaceae bacterium]|nr:30S ribosomal protein S1 [Ardenticatenaceae bacterium]MCB8948010.1 30S ribosomal protein S1 [Ardenticatenaceae bacterium]
MQNNFLMMANTEQTNSTNGNEHTPFFDLIEEYDFPQPQRGDIIHGEILRIDRDVVFIDIGSKRDAMVPYQEVAQLDDEFLENLSTGDTVPVYVTRTPVGSEQLLVSLERGLQELDWERAAKLHEDDTTVELKIVNYNKGGFVVEFGRIQGFVPNSHIPTIQNVYNHDQRTSYKSKQVDNTIKLKIIELDPQRERFVLSAKSAQKDQRKELLSSLSIGDKFTGTVVNLKHYGAFIDIGDGLVGLLHISRMAWEHINKPDDLFSVGDEVEVLVDKIDVEKEKISLNRKALLPSPWQTFADKQTAGDLVAGEVTAVVDFGAFVRVDEGIEGLLHKNEMNIPSDTAPSEALAEGDVILVRIVQIDVEQERLSLSTRRVTASEEISWMQSRQEAEAEFDAETVTEDAEAETETVIE